MFAGTKVFAIALIALAASSGEISARESCELGSVNNASELTDALSERAVEVIKRASGPNWKTDKRLDQLVQPSAVADLGSGDVGRPLGTGTSGVHALADEMQAETFSYSGWGGIPVTVEPCEEHYVNIDFSSAANQLVSSVKFTFLAGRLVSAKGWQMPFKSGPMR